MCGRVIKVIWVINSYLTFEGVIPEGQQHSVTLVFTDQSFIALVLYAYFLVFMISLLKCFTFVFVFVLF